MDGEQRIDGLELGAGGVDDGSPPARGARPARPSRQGGPRERHPRGPSRHAGILAAPPGVREIPHMVATVARRTLAGLAVVVGAVTLTFFLVRLAPGDPVERLLGPQATAAQLAVQRHALGLDRPLPAQYGSWLARVARGDWGRSIATGRPGPAVLGEARPRTGALARLSLGPSYPPGDSRGG